MKVNPWENDTSVFMGYAPGLGSFGVPVSSKKWGIKPNTKYMPIPKKGEKWSTFDPNQQQFNAAKEKFLRLKKLAAKMDEGGE